MAAPEGWAQGRPVPAVPVRLGSTLLGGPASLLCAPLVAETPEALALEAEQAGARGADLVEWRADYLAGLSPGDVPTLLATVRSRSRVPVLFTCRASFEGGATLIPEEGRIAILEAAVLSGSADLVDLELAMAPEARNGLLALARRHGVPVLLSSHDFQRTPDEQEILGLLARQQAAGAAVAKVATMAQTAVDGLHLLSACARARAEFLRIPLAGIAMGAAGAFTRVLGPLFGVDLTFAMAVRGSAPGQLDLQDVRQARRLMGTP